MVHTHTHLPIHVTHTHVLPGFVLEGFDLEHSCELLGTVIRATTELLPVDKPRFIHGISTPGESL